MKPRALGQSHRSYSQGAQASRRAPQLGPFSGALAMLAPPNPDCPAIARSCTLSSAVAPLHRAASLLTPHLPRTPVVHSLPPLWLPPGTSLCVPLVGNRCDGAQSFVRRTSYEHRLILAPSSNRAGSHHAFCPKLQMRVELEHPAEFNRLRSASFNPGVR
jgi:hypothetical protein